MKNQEIYEAVREKIKYIYPEPKSNEFSSKMRFRAVHTQWATDIGHVARTIADAVPEKSTLTKTHGKTGKYMKSSLWFNKGHNSFYDTLLSNLRGKK